MRTVGRLLRFQLGRYYWPLKKLLDVFLIRYKQCHYAQFGEDIAICEYFKNTKKGVYVDVGAFHPRQFSNTYMLYQKGWRGLTVDATPGSSDLFRLIRPRDIAVECLVSNREEEREFLSWGNHLENSADPKQCHALIRRLGEPLHRIKMKSRKLSTLIDENLPGQKVDLLSVDAEGSDLEVLESFDWEGEKPELVIVEAFEFDINETGKSGIYCFLQSKGYKLMTWLRPSLIFKLNA